LLLNNEEQHALTSNNIGELQLSESLLPFLTVPIVLTLNAYSQQVLQDSSHNISHALTTNQRQASYLSNTHTTPYVHFNQQFNNQHHAQLA